MLNVRELLAGCYPQTGRLEEAETILHTVLQLQQRQLEHDHAGTCRMAKVLCSLSSNKYAEQGTLETAYEKLSQYVADLRVLVDHYNDHLLDVLSYLAAVCVKFGNEDEAEKILQEVLPNSIESWGRLGDRSIQNGQSYSGDGGSYDNSNRHQEALSVSCRTKMARTQELDINHQLTLAAQSYFARTLFGQGR